MFTGIIEEIGTVKEFTNNGSTAFITIECNKILEGNNHSPLTHLPLHHSLIGDSIAIEGVCQTVTKFDKNSFSAQVSAETLNVTTFANLKKGQQINLERALTLNSRLGGHIVTGHVDGLGKIKNIQKLSDFYNIKFEVEKDLYKYIAKKGSIAINGISLTIANVASNGFEIAVIPHTFENTTLKNLKTGDFVNIECDILAKYVEKLLSTDNNKSLDEKFLKENGFF